MTGTQDIAQIVNPPQRGKACHVPDCCGGLCAQCQDQLGKPRQLGVVRLVRLQLQQGKMKAAQGGQLAKDWRGGGIIEYDQFGELLTSRQPCRHT